MQHGQRISTNDHKVVENVEQGIFFYIFLFPAVTGDPADPERRAVSTSVICGMWESREIDKERVRERER